MQRVNKSGVQKRLRCAGSALDIEILDISQFMDRLRRGEGGYFDRRGVVCEYISLRAAGLDSGQADIEARPVSIPSASAHQNCILPGTLSMYVSAGMLTSDPLVSPGFARNKAIFGHGQLQCNEWPRMGFACQKSRETLLGVGVVEYFNIDSRVTKSGDALARCARIGVTDADDNARGFGICQQVRAGRSTRGLMRTRLKCYIYGCAFCTAYGQSRQSHRLCMWASTCLCPAARLHNLIFHNDTCDGGVGAT